MSETIMINRYQKTMPKDGITKMYQVWYHQWEHLDGKRKRIHERIYPTHNAETFCNSRTAKQFILNVKKYPLAYPWYRPKFGDRLSIRSYKRYFIEYISSNLNRQGTMENFGIFKITKHPNDNKMYVTIFFTSYKDGCKWIKDHYKEYHMTNVGVFKNYLLKLVKKWSKEAGSNEKINKNY